MNLLASGAFRRQIATAIRVSLAAVRREVDRAFAERPIVGEEIVMTRYGKPVAHILAVPRAVAPKKPPHLEELAPFRARMPHWSKASAELLREMRAQLMRYPDRAW